MQRSVDCRKLSPSASIPLLLHLLLREQPRIGAENIVRAKDSSLSYKWLHKQGFNSGNIKTHTNTERGTSHEITALDKDLQAMVTLERGQVNLSQG